MKTDSSLKSNVRESTDLSSEELQMRWKEAVSKYSGGKKPALVGIFWYHGKKVYGDFCCLSAAEPYGNILGPNSNHVDFWPQVQKQVQELRFEEYENKPRGRLLFDLAAGQFVLISSQAIVKSKSAVKAICRRCNIPADMDVILRTDLHYESPENLDWEDPDDCGHS